MSNRSSSPASLVRKAVQLEVAVLRTPLLLADQLAVRFGAQDAVRPKVRQGMALLDALADRVSGGSAQSSTPPRAAKPRPAPAKAKEPAPREVVDEEPSADAPPEPSGPDEAELIEEVTEELLDEQEVAPLAGELADDDELRRVQAELNAKRLVEEQQEERPH